MDNFPCNNLRVPGFGIPLTHDLPGDQRFAHGINDWFQTPAVTARELAMTEIMNMITDKPYWWNNLDDAINSFRNEDDHPLMSEKAWNWCISELKDKAVEFHQKRFVRVLDTGSCVCKSDELLHASVSAALKDSLNADCIVDPYLHPLVYGESRIANEPLNMTDLLIPDSKSTISHEHPARITPSRPLPRMPSQPGRHSDRYDLYRIALAFMRSHVEPEDFWWSSRYQVLPCDVVLEDSTVRSVSYINNLHPKHKTAYEAIEKILSASVKMWNECLIKGHNDRSVLNQTQRGRYPLRIHTFGAEWHNELPSWARAFCKSHIQELEAYIKEKELFETGAAYRSYQETLETGRAHCRLDLSPYLEGIPPVVEPNEETCKLAEDYVGRPLEHNADIEGLLTAEACRRRFWTQPEPGTAFSYEDWLAGHGTKSIVKMIAHERKYSPAPIRKEPTHTPYDVHLEKFKELQIVVKIGGFTVSPGEKDKTLWQFDGHMNEHIVARALYVYDIGNADCTISFCQETPMPCEVYRSLGHQQPRCTKDDPSAYHYTSRSAAEDAEAIAGIFGLPSADTTTSNSWPEEDAPVQRTGTIILKQGRLITFPNVLEYQIETTSTSLNVPGHVRYVFLDLVDPNYRICSTRNVPPQQSEWWKLSVGEILRRRLPAELVDHVMAHYEPGMNQVRAEKHREEMQQEQGWIGVARNVAMPSCRFGWLQTGFHE